MLDRRAGRLGRQRVLVGESAHVLVFNIDLAVALVAGDLNIVRRALEANLAVPRRGRG